MVEFDRRTAAAIFVILLFVMLRGTFASSVSLSRKAMVSVGLLTFYVGI